MNWHRLSITEVYELMGSSENGISSSHAEALAEQFGPNQLQETKKKTFVGILVSQFKDVMILILLAAAIVSGIIGDITDTVVILFIVLINALVGFIQEYRAEKAMEALKQMAVTYAKVVRSGNVITVPSISLVPGDIVMLEAGDAVPADIRIASSIHLKIEEAALTGESQPVEKITDALEIDDLPITDQANMAFKGTFVSYGRGMGIVTATGMGTELGRIAKMLQSKDVLSPLQQRMGAFGKKLSILILFLCVLFFTVGFLRGEDVLKMIMTSISLAVASIPEALPTVIVISLALAARRMVKQNSLIRKLPAVETLGSVTYICTDKTGTITKNKMYVEDVTLQATLISRKDLSTIKHQEDLHMLLMALALNNDVVKEGATLKGDPTEIALVELTNELQVPTDEWPRLKEIPFDSDRKLMTTFHPFENKFISFTKGAPDMLLQRCINTDTSLLQQKVDEMARKGQRVLGFAYRFWDTLPNNPESSEAEKELQFLGLTGMIDPQREEVFEAVSQCKTAGIVPVMITGDHPITAQVIAERVGILAAPTDRVLTGHELSKMDEQTFASIVSRVKVYARVSPEQKLQIVKMLQKKGQYVAMTGDGVNDAPSLKRANIGVAMGITGTDVSKEAAHMILLDDNFSTIVKAIKEGRRVYDNILKFIKYLMTTNSGELWTLLIGPILGLPIALLPIHILWINLVSDSLPAIALSFEKGEKNIMHRPPRPPKQSVFADGRGIHIIWVGLLMATITLAAQYVAIRQALHWQTIVFNLLCLSQMTHVMAIRSQNQSLFSMGIFSNKPLIISVILVLCLQFIVTYTPILQPVFKTETLNLYEFLAVGALSTIIFFAVEIEKSFARKNKKERCKWLIGE